MAGFIEGVDRGQLSLLPESLDQWVEDSNPVRVIAFNTAEGWSRDVSENVAHELRRRCAEQARELPAYLLDFVERQEARAAR